MSRCARDQGPPPYEVLAALLVSLRQELVDAQAALAQVTSELAGTRTELGRARERIAELEACGVPEVCLGLELQR